MHRQLASAMAKKASTAQNSESAYTVSMTMSALAEEIDLLQKAGEDELIMQLIDCLTAESDVVIEPTLVKRMDQIERELDALERQCRDVRDLKDEVADIQEKLDMRP